jgi:hypothetical protein
MVASRTRKGSYPSSLMRETTAEIGPVSERDLLMASPNSFHPFFELLVHVVLRLASGFCVIVMPDAGYALNVSWL